jgi:hypothetical protein
MCREGELMECLHPHVPEPVFDKRLCDVGELDTETIRRMFPRIYMMCPDCKRTMIKYASKAHYVYGDW